MQKKLRTKKEHPLLLLLTFLLIVSPGLYFILTYNTSQNSLFNNFDFNNINLPKTNAGEITIITPENVTYTKAMSGFYPATYGFENDKIGDNPYGWTTSELGLQNIEIISSLDGHNNVLELFDTEAGSEAIAQAYNSFASQTSGTIEFWYRTGGTQEDQHFRVLEGVNYGIYFGLKSGNFQYYNISGWHTLTSGNSDQWYHIRFDFDCTSDTYDFYLDNVLIQSNLEFFTPVNALNQIEFLTRQWGTSSDFYSYVDALGYSWDPNYNIGDNRFEGLLLSFDNSTSLDWVGYSLDNQANKTVLGNASITMPDPGSHKIQVFGNSSLGTMYQSSIRYFSISPINLITPENKTYSEPISGYYPATFGFEDDQVGTIPEGLTDESPYGSCSISVYDQKDQHKQIVQIYDANTGTGADAIAQYNFESPKVTGTIECWVYKESGDCALIINGINDTTTGFQISIDAENNGMFRYAPAPSTYVEFAVGKYSDQNWFHIRIDFDCDTNTTDIYVNGIKEVEDGLFHLPVPNISAILIRSGHSGRSGVLYFDALGLSWDLNYNNGDNRYEGLLISLENKTTLDWLGYSLDGQSNKTILGNTTIPFLNNGLHSILLTVNDTFGKYFISELRYFTVLISGPNISAITPLLNQYYGVSAPSFSIDIQGVNIDKFWYSLDNGITNISFYSYFGDISQSEWDKYTHEPVQINFYVNDSFNRIGYDVVTVNKDLSAPTTAINFVPYSGINVVIISTQFSLSATDSSESGVSTTQYKISDSAWIPYTGAFTLSGYDSGFYTITYQSIDAVGNIETEKSVEIELYIPPPPPDIPNLFPLLLTIIGIAIVVLLGITIFLLIRKRTPKTPIKARTDEKSQSGSDQFKVCPFCYAQIKINAKYCTLCGASLEKD